MPNVASLVFAEEQGSFLVGAAAALKTKAGHIGFVGGVKVALIEKFEAGYVAGAKAVKPDITVDVTYLTQPPDFSGFNDPAKGKTAAQACTTAARTSSTTRPVAPVAASSRPPPRPEVWRSASTPTSTTADPAVQAVILTSMMKRVDVAVYEESRPSSTASAPGRRQGCTT